MSLKTKNKHLCWCWLTPLLFLLLLLMSNRFAYWLPPRSAFLPPLWSASAGEQLIWQEGDTVSRRAVLKPDLKKKKKTSQRKAGGRRGKGFRKREERRTDSLSLSLSVFWCNGICYFRMKRRTLWDAASSICWSCPRCLYTVRGSTETVFFQLAGPRTDLTQHFDIIYNPRISTVKKLQPFFLVCVFLFWTGDSFRQAACALLISCLVFSLLASIYIF